MVLHFVDDVGEAIRIALASMPELSYHPLLINQPILPLFANREAEAGSRTSAISATTIRS